MEDLAGNPLAQQSIEAVAPGVPAEQGILEALLLAVGQQADEQHGNHAALLTTQLEAEDVNADIESVLGWESAGSFVVDGLEVSYSSVAAPDELPQLKGLTWPDGAAGKWPPSTVIEDATRRYSGRDQARADMSPTTATGEWLHTVARSFGEQAKPWPMSDATMQQLLATLLYLDRGSVWAVFRVLDAALAEYITTRTDGVTAAATPQRLSSANGTFAARHIHRWVRIAGNAYRIVDVDTATGAWVDLAPGGGLWWIGAQFGDTSGVTFEMLPFAIEEDPTVYPGRPQIRVFLPASFATVPPSYLQADGSTLTPPGVPKGGQIMADENELGSGGQPLYLGGGTGTAIADWLDDVLALGITADVHVGEP